MTSLVFFTWVLVGTSPPDAGPSDSCPHAAAVEMRGDIGMGFDHRKTGHHFALTAEGGTISADALDADDVDSQESIRRHMSHIAKAFADGNFDMPMFIHGRVPPGTSTLKRLRARIRYQEEDTPHGARVVIRTVDAEALKAVHAFLRFQMEDHHTGDSPEVAQPSGGSP
jgi:hypothetical protein